MANKQWQKYNSNIKNNLSNNKLNEGNNTIDQIWTTFKNVIQDVANNHLTKSKIPKNKITKVNFYNLKIVYLLNAFIKIIRKVNI